MAGKVTEKRKEELKLMQNQLNELSDIIQKIIDEKSSLADLARKYNSTTQRINDCMNDGLEILLRKTKVLTDSDINIILENIKSPIENLVCKMLGTEELIILDIAEEDKVLELIEEVLSEKENDIIKKRFGIGCQAKTLREVSEIYNVTKERIMQIERKALRKLHNPIVLRKLLPNYELEIICLQESEKMVEIKESITSIDASVENLKVSKQSYNCLKRRGVDTIKQLSELSKKDLSKVRGLGPKALNEITSALKQQYGITLKE
jgi:hypothetical protein